MTLIQYLITDTEWTKNLHVIAYSPEIASIGGILGLSNEIARLWKMQQDTSS